MNALPALKNAPPRPYPNCRRIDSIPRDRSKYTGKRSMRPQIFLFSLMKPNSREGLGRSKNVCNSKRSKSGEIRETMPPPIHSCRRCGWWRLGRGEAGETIPSGGIHDDAKMVKQCRKNVRNELLPTYASLYIRLAQRKGKIYKR